MDFAWVFHLFLRRLQQTIGRIGMGLENPVGDDLSYNPDQDRY
jgi:hypothetical protein